MDVTKLYYRSSTKATGKRTETVDGTQTSRTHTLDADAYRKMKPTALQIDTNSTVKFQNPNAYVTHFLKVLQTIYKFILLL
jgi:hypothetical protein